MACNLKIDVEIEAVPSPQWVKDGNSHPYKSSLP
jgi:hypothetical protein